MVALSGGVDSAVTAALLHRQGFSCRAVYMVTCDAGLTGQAEVQRVADRLDIPLLVLDLRREFEAILDYFLGEYRKGRTPNPCVRCNRQIKFGRLWDLAQSIGTDRLATGHYANILLQGGRAGLFEADHKTKDQSYVLAMVRPDMLRHILFPMGRCSKGQTRQIASELGLGLEHKAESQEICFIANDDYAAVLQQRCPELVRQGRIVDTAGKILGHHQGIHHFTLGQRRGLRVAMGEPWYVVRLEADTNTVVLGPRNQVLHSGLLAGCVNWLVDPPGSPFRAKVKIRYNDKGRPAEVTPQEETVTVRFDEPAAAITPGQLAVFYTLDPIQAQVLGGAWIDMPLD